MPSRVIASFLAVVLLWSGLGTIEAPRALAQPSPSQQQVIAHAGGQAAGHEGSLEHHHLDDLPSRSQADPLGELTVLLPPPLMRSSAPLSRLRPACLDPAAVRSPDLERLLRPPRSVRNLA